MLLNDYHFYPFKFINRLYQMIIISSIYFILLIWYLNILFLFEAATTKITASKGRFGLGLAFFEFLVPEKVNKL